MSTSNRHTIDLLQPGTTVESEALELLRVAEILHYPLIIRSSSDSDHESITIIHSSSELQGYLS